MLAPLKWFLAEPPVRKFAKEIVKIRRFDTNLLPGKILSDSERIFNAPSTRSDNIA